MSDKEVGGAISSNLPPLLSVEATRQACGRRGRGWVYERIAAGDFETITDGGRRLVVTESILNWLAGKRAEAAREREFQGAGA